jgi:Mg2+/citrate symporter
LNWYSRGSVAISLERQLFQHIIDSAQEPPSFKNKPSTMATNDALKEGRTLALASSFFFLAGMLLAAIAVILPINYDNYDATERRVDAVDTIATAGMFIVAAWALPEIAIDLPNR